jgi:hypothetical protein
MFIIVAGARQYWVWGWLYREAIKDRDSWKRIALSGTRLLETAAEKTRRENVERDVPED